MHKLARFALLGATLFAACAPQPYPEWSPPSQPTTLHVAFDDIPAKKAQVVPMSLTSATGAGLELVSLTGRAILDDPLAFTELHLVFENPEDRVLEGNFNIVLPQGAAVSRFAMRNEQGFQEGEVVEKQRAREAYEDSLHRRQDPALLEQNAGNEFSARVFPIPARGRKEIVLSYTQEVTRGTPYVLSLKGLPRIRTLDVEANLAGHAAPVRTLKQSDATPSVDFRIDANAARATTALRNGEIMVARVAPITDSRPEPLTGALVLVDTSASRALGMAEEARVIGDLCASMAKAHGDQARVLVAAYDQEIETLYQGRAAKLGPEPFTRMRQRLALGASDLGGALVWAAKAAREQGLSRVVVVTDGVPTAGETTGEKLRAIAAQLKTSGVERIDAVAVGGIRDDELLRSVVNAGLPRGGVVVDGERAPEEIWRRLSEATRSGLKVEVEGADFVFPRVVDGVQAGDEVLVYATVPHEGPMRVSVGEGPKVTLTPTPTERPLLERAWVGARIRSLLEEERTQGPSNRLSDAIVSLSTRYRVLSPKTALLVLETDADYARFGLDRRALAEVLIAEGSRVGLMSRVQQVAAKVPPPVAATPKAAKEKSSDKGADAPKKLEARRGPADRKAAEVDVDAKQDVSQGAPRPSPRPPSRMLAPEKPAPMKDEEGARPRGAPMVPAPIAAAPMAPPPMAPPPMATAAPMAAPPPPPPARPPSPEATAVARARMAAPAAADEAPGYAFGDDPNASTRDVAAREAEEAKVPKADPYTGPFKTVMDLLFDRKTDAAVKTAFEWRKTDPGDVMALVALGEGFEAAGDVSQAARCYGSIIDLFPGRADLRRFAGQRLERLPASAGLDIALDTFAKAVEQRPDHPESHRLYAYALLRKGQMEKAFAAIVAGLKREYPSGRFNGVPRILQEDAGLIGAAWARAEPKRAAEIRARILAEGGAIEDAPSIRFILNWETDANDVDFHIYDAKGGHAFYQNMRLPSGGELYADVTTGYGPECFTIRGRPEDRHGPYKLQAHYYSRGPMGYGMGKLEIIEHDGQGGLRFEERPFVVMVDHGFVDLGTVER